MSSSDLSAFLSWFEQNGASYDNSAIGFKDFGPNEGGRGAIALRDIPVSKHPLPSLPKTVIHHTPMN